MIQTLRPDGKRGIWMNEDEYYSMQLFILEVLEEYEQLTLSNLITIAGDRFQGQHAIGFIIMHVKTDLLARNMIKETKRLRNNKFSLISLRNIRRSSLSDKKDEFEKLERISIL